MTETDDKYPYPDGIIDRYPPSEFCCVVLKVPNNLQNITPTLLFPQLCFCPFHEIRKTSKKNGCK
mgnify:CR=1 FL=1